MHVTAGNYLLVHIMTWKTSYHAHVMAENWLSRVRHGGKLVIARRSWRETSYRVHVMAGN